MIRINDVNLYILITLSFTFTMISLSVLLEVITLASADQFSNHKIVCFCISIKLLLSWTKVVWFQKWESTFSSVLILFYLLIRWRRGQKHLLVVMKQNILSFWVVLNLCFTFIIGLFRYASIKIFFRYMLSTCQIVLNGFI